MLTGFRVRNFKAFEDTQTIDLKPLVLLSGVNSAGKSSILQALLLLKQTLESNPGQVLNPTEPLFLGTSDDFLFRENQGRADRPNLVYNLTFAYASQHDTSELMPSKNMRKEKVEYKTHDGFEAAYFQNETMGSISFIDQNDIALFEKLSVFFPNTDVVSDTGNRRLTCQLNLVFAWDIVGMRDQRVAQLSRLEIVLEIDGKPLLGLAAAQRGKSDNYKLSLIEHKTSPELRNLPAEQLSISSFDHFLPESFIISSQQVSNTQSYSPLPQFLRHLFGRIRDDLTERVRYLSSHREPPSPVYGFSYTNDSLNPSGSDFAQVLWQYRRKPVYYAQPGPFFPDTSRRYEMPLAATIAWIMDNVLDLEQPVSVDTVGEHRDIFEVTLETLGKDPISVTLASVGLGYNQILPVIIQGLLTPPGGLVIFEQPEIHLHPNVQAKLVQFFLGLAKAGRRVLVETHSSHMIDHLCLAIAKDQETEDWLARNTAVLFVHPPDQDNTSARIEPVEIDPFGHILNLPRNFMPDIAGVYEETLKAGYAKRRMRQSEEKDAI